MAEGLWQRLRRLFGGSAGAPSATTPRSPSAAPEKAGAAPARAAPEGSTSGPQARAPAPAKTQKPWQPAKPDFADAERARILACSEDEVQALAATITSTLLASLDKIPPFPVIASRLVQTLESRDVRADAIERLITQDAVIAARILSTANSSFYSPPSTIETLPHAIRTIGLQEVGRIALSVASAAVFDVDERIAHESVARPQRLAWAHSLATARGAAWLALHLNQDVQRAYVAGLLHDIGKPVALRGLGLALTGGRLPAQPLPAVVHAAVEACHVDVASMVADAWKLAPHLAAVVTEHHASSATDPLVQIVTLVSAVDELRTNPAHRAQLLEQVQELARGLQVTPVQLSELDFELKKAASLAAG